MKYSLNQLTLWLDFNGVGRMDQPHMPPTHCGHISHRRRNVMDHGTRHHSRPGFVSIHDFAELDRYNQGRMA